jgi:hypothetical protein
VADTDPVSAEAEILYAEENLLCNAWFEDRSEDPDDEGLLVECTKPSRFCVSRSDGDQSYGTGGGTEEACEEHLADAVCGMVDGHEHIQAIVAIRWDRYEEVPDAG